MHADEAAVTGRRRWIRARGPVATRRVAAPPARSAAGPWLRALLTRRLTRCATISPAPSALSRRSSRSTSWLRGSSHSAKRGRGNDHRHPVVDVGDRLRRRGRDQRARLERLTRGRVAPGFPQCRERERPAARGPQEIGLLVARTELHPLVVPIGRHQRATLAIGRCGMRASRAGSRRAHWSCGRRSIVPWPRPARAPSRASQFAASLRCRATSSSGSSRTAGMKVVGAML